MTQLPDFDSLFQSSLGFVTLRLDFNDQGQFHGIRFHNANQVYLNAFGLQQVHLQGQLWQEVIPGINHPESLQALIRIVQKGGSGSFDIFDYHRSRWYKTLVWVKEDQVVGMAFTDISDVQMRLSDLEKFFTLSLDLLCIAHSDGTFYKLNKAWELLLGQCLDKLEGGNFFSFLHPDDVLPTQEIFRKLQAGQQVSDFSNRFLCSNKDVRYLEWRAVVYGEHVYAAARDITQQRLTALKLQKQLDFQLLLNKVTSGFVNASAATIDQVINHALQQMGAYFGADRCYVFQYVAEGSMMSNTHEWCAPGIESQISRLQDLSVHDIPWWHEQLQQKRTLHVPDVDALPGEAEAERQSCYQQGIKSLLSIPMINEGMLVGCYGMDAVSHKRTWSPEEISQYILLGEVIAGVLAKINAEKASADYYMQLQRHQESLEILNESLEKRVRQEVERNRQKDQLVALQLRQSALGEMLANVAHQWRQPLSALSMLIYDLKAAFDNQELSRNYLERNVEQANTLMQQMSRILDDSRNFFQPQEHKQIFNLVDPVQKAIAYLAKPLEEAGIALQVDSVPELWIEGYINEIVQVVVNILKNAQEAIAETKPEDPCIRLQMEQEARHASIRIYNCGMHIPEELAEKIFDPYYTTWKKPGGLGLGLYIARIIVENNMDGKLSFENLPQGVVFKISLPLVEQNGVV